MYEAPTHAISAVMMDVSFRKVAGGPAPIRAITEACRRAVAAELGSQIQILTDRLIAADGPGRGDMSTAIEQLRRRLSEVVTA